MYLDSEAEMFFNLQNTSNAMRDYAETKHPRHLYHHSPVNNTYVCIFNWVFLSTHYTFLGFSKYNGG
jgi:hypothetical protein